MSEELLINVTRQETRVAVLENGVLQEFHLERNHNRGIVANIYNGKITRILPGLQAAFVDINQKRSAFLHEADMFCARDTGFEKNKHAINTNNTPNHNHQQRIPIQDRLREGQKIIVQVIKDPLGDKGARLTTQLTIPARHLVLLPLAEHIGISQKIRNPVERERLQNLLKGILDEQGKVGGYIVRTIAESASREELIEDIAFLNKLWAVITRQIKEQTEVGLIHEAIPLLFRTMRDLADAKVDRILIDSQKDHDKAVEFIKDIIPGIADKIEHYKGERPIFELFSIEDEIGKALNKKVPLKSGGHLIIDQTEAMTTIDVNTGGFVGRSNMEETLFKTNLEACQALARQLRLRNIGGIIIVDFIDMTDDEHKSQVVHALETALSRDRVKSFISQISILGLVEITRKRTRESLGQMLCETCPVCNGDGLVKSPETICYNIFREIIRETQHFKADKYLIIASQIVVNTLHNQEAKNLQHLQDSVGRPIDLQVDPLYLQEVYDIILM